MDLTKLSVSNGSGEAVRALVTVLRAPGGTVITPNSLVNWPTNFVATTGPLLADGTLDPTKTIVFLGHISGSTIVIDQLAPGYTDTYGSAVGDVVVIKPNTWWADTLVNSVKSSTQQITDFVAAGGWNPLSTMSVSAVTANGNRSYDLTTTTSQVATLMPGTRLKTTRTVAAPTQSTSLNGTNQYWSKTTPNGMTFTDDFVAGAWVKLSSYAYGTIISRFNGTSGWELSAIADGRIQLVGYNAASGNYSFVQSYQSLPLNKWVHVAAQLDMSAFTATTTTSYVMFDGADVPSVVSRAGTNPTALIQAGNLEVGSQNAGTRPFPGKVAQAFVSSAKITQANIRTLYSQGLTPALISANSIISAYSFDGVATDLNTTNANNLTANGSATATNADSPFGGQAGGTISSTLDYAIVQKVTSSTVTVQVAEGCTIPTSGGVTSVGYSNAKVPFGFPSEKTKWRISQIYRGVSNTSWSGGGWASSGWYFTLPAGTWDFGFEGIFERNDTAANSLDLRLTLHTSTAAAGPSSLTTALVCSVGTTSFAGAVRVQDAVTVASQTTYYNNQYIATGTAVTGWYGGNSRGSEFRNFADNAYL